MRHAAERNKIIAWVKLPNFCSTFLTFGLFEIVYQIEFCKTEKNKRMNFDEIVREGRGGGENTWENSVNEHSMYMWRK